MENISAASPGLTDALNTTLTPDGATAWSDESFDKALFVYIIAGVCLLVMLVLLIKYALCAKQIKALSRTRGSRSWSAQRLGDVEKYPDIAASNASWNHCNNVAVR